MALKDYSTEERGIIGEFLKDTAVWRGIGMDPPAGDFEDLERLTELRRREVDAVKARFEREEELINSFCDETGRVAGRLPLLIRQAVKSVMDPGTGRYSVYTMEREFQKYMEILRDVCRILTGDR